MKLLKNPQVTQPNQSQVIKVKSVQSFRDLFRTKLKMLAFVYWIAKKAPSKLHVELCPEYPQLLSWWQRHHNSIIHLVLVLLLLAFNKFCILVFMHIQHIAEIYVSIILNK